MKAACGGGPEDRHETEPGGMSLASGDPEPAFLWGFCALRQAVKGPELAYADVRIPENLFATLFTESGPNFPLLFNCSSCNYCC